MPPRAGDCVGRGPRHLPRRGGRAAGAGTPLLVGRALNALPLLSKCDLITQIYAAQQDLPLREFASYFNGHTRLTVPPCLTSHEIQKSSSHVIPMYPSLAQQTLKWYLNETNACENYDEEPQYSCRCVSCTSARCPGDAAARTTTRDEETYPFKTNIMTFCDQETMTPKVNDVSCGICLGVGAVLGKKDMNISTNKSMGDLSLQDASECTQSVVDEGCGSTVKRIMRAASLKPLRRKTLIYEQCAQYEARPQQAGGARHEAVRDTDPEHCAVGYEDSCHIPHPNPCDRPLTPPCPIQFTPPCSMEFTPPCPMQFTPPCPIQFTPPSPKQFTLPRNKPFTTPCHPASTLAPPQCTLPGALSPDKECSYWRERSWENLRACQTKDRQCHARQNYKYVDQKEVEEKSYGTNYASKLPSRKMLYNEGISDDIANNLTQTFRKGERQMQPRTSSNMSVGWCRPEVETWIPYSHTGKSRYHTHCRQPTGVRYRADVDAAEGRAGADPRNMKKVIYSRPVDRDVCRNILPLKKLLPSEKEINSYICRGARTDSYN